MTRSGVIGAVRHCWTDQSVAPVCVSVSPVPGIQEDYINPQVLALGGQHNLPLNCNTTIMWFKDNSAEAAAHSQVTGGGHTAKLSHELIAAAASYEAAKAYEHHVAKNGKPVNHQKAVELVAALSGAFIDRIAETKGMDELDKQRAKHDAQKRAQEALQQHGQF